MKAKFRTAYGQREIPMELAVIGSTDLEVGQLVKITAKNGNVPAYITAAASISDATHMIAQSDMTMEYGHVPVEDRNYAYSPKVKCTAASATASSPVKKVALFALIDKDDVIVNS